MKKILIAAAAVLLLVSGIICVELGFEDSEEEQRKDRIWAALVLMALAETGFCPGGCSLDGVCFEYDAGITCENGQASGSGTLAARYDGGTFLSLQADVKLSAGGSLDFNTGVTENVSTRSSGISIVLTGESRWFEKTASGDLGAGVPPPGQDATQTYCLESHVDEGHVFLRREACPDAAIDPEHDSLTEEESTRIDAKTGRGWGFLLKNATVSGIDGNANKRFSD